MASTEISSYTITNKNGVKLTCISLGATITSLQLPDGTDITLGFKDIEDYRTNSPYLGCSVGRVTNRIRDAKFTIEDQTYTVSANVAPHTLHGGAVGFNKANWTVKSTTGNSIVMEHVSPSGDQGYPGTLTATVTYTLNDDNEVTITYGAVTDATTIVNLVNHTYFNLAGKGTIHDHVLQINGSSYTPLDKDLICIGTLAPVAGTPLDFTKATPIGARLEEAGGYDINYNLLEIQETYPNDALLRAAAILRDPSSQRELRVYTDQAGVQLYSGNFLDGSYIGKDGQPIIKYGGVCLETQSWPNAINNPEAREQVMLRPGQEYKSRTVWTLTW